MKDTPLRLYDISVRMKWDIETAAEYEKNVHDIMRYTEMRGKPLAIEYIDENLNVIKTLKIEGNKVTVTTDYSESEEGFGEEYIGSESQDISINLSSINLNTESGDLKVSLVYGNEELVSLETSLVEGEEVSVETAAEIVEEKEVEKTEETITNTTSGNVTKTEVSSGELSEEEINVLASEFGKVSVEVTNAERSENGVIVKLELGNYWVEHYYSPEVSDEKLQELVEEDKVKLLKDLSKKLLEQETSKERIEALIG